MYCRSTIVQCTCMCCQSVFIYRAVPGTVGLLTSLQYCMFIFLHTLPVGSMDH